MQIDRNRPLLYSKGASNKCQEEFKGCTFTNFDYSTSETE